MLLLLDFSSEEPIYLQIRDQLVLGIAGGHLPVGEKLPTIRALANETGVNVMTVNKAYQLLKHEGYISADRHGGTIVAGTMPEVSSAKILDDLKLRAASLKLSGYSCTKWLELCEKAYNELSDTEGSDESVDS